MKKITNLILLTTLFIFTNVTFADWKQPALSHNLTAFDRKIEARDFELMNMDEEKVKLADYRGKVVLINFWATWCPPCVREMPSMERLNKKIANENFKVLAINQMEDSDQVFAFTGQFEDEPSFEILFDTTSKVSQSYIVRGLPTTYLIDKKGHVRYSAVGGREFDHPEIVKVVKKLLDE